MMANSNRHVRLSLKERSHSIHIGSGAVFKLPQWLNQKIDQRDKRAFILSDEKLTKARAVLRSVLSQAGWKVHEILVAGGEGLKNFEVIYPLYGELLKAKAGRDSTLFALGGGSVGDAAGFIAATYLRGISWIGLPTTLLAQVDSSVGGKTGVNHPSGKNLIGAFHQPIRVVCDTDFLNTLSSREIVSGLGEVVKYGLIFDPKFYQELKEQLGQFLALDSKVLTWAIHRSLVWKCRIVSRDEFDRKGIREALNFGHTFAHALESVTNYQVFRHGEAVIWGMRFAIALSQCRNKISNRSGSSIDEFLASLPVPAIPNKIGPASIFEAIGSDKKVREGKINFVLLKKVGKVISDHQVRQRDLLQAYRTINPGPRSESIKKER